jgi:hypothetical protein
VVDNSLAETSRGVDTTTADTLFSQPQKVDATPALPPALPEDDNVPAEVDSFAALPCQVFALTDPASDVPTATSRPTQPAANNAGSVEQTAPLAPALSGAAASAPAGTG